MNLCELKQETVTHLIKVAEELGIEHASRMRKQEIIFSILKALAKKGEDIYA
nr:transcription termination factor Rho [Legionellales bacterium]